MISRRRYVTAAGTGLAAALAGCSGSSGSSGGGGSTSTSTSSSSGETEFNELEIMIAWTGEDGAAAFEALHNGFKEEYPNVPTKINDNPGGAGTGLATALDTRLFNDNPPGTWGFFPGKDLAPFAEAGLLASVTDSVWEQGNFSEVFPEYIDRLHRFEGIGHIGVPIEFNRLNNLFYNVEVVEEAGVDPSSISAPSDLVAAMEQVESETDAVGMAQSSKGSWTVFQLWETILLGEYGYDVYTTYLDGDIESIEEEIKGALEVYKEYRQFFNEDAGSISFNESASTLIAGEAAFYHQGDWAVGNFNRAEGFEYDEQWQHVPFPGSGDAFLGQAASFMYPANNPAPESTIRWLRYAGTTEAQIRFNSIKGGVPCRKDAPMDDDEFSFNAHQKSQYEDFLNANNLNGTIAHNNVVVPQIKTNMYDVFSTFKGSYDIEKGYNGIVEAFEG
jgi:glucose/mannose transport system substrate-binding protein